MPVNVFFWINPVRSVMKICVPHSRMSIGAPHIQFPSEVIKLEKASMFFSFTSSAVESSGCPFADS